VVGKPKNEKASDAGEFGTPPLGDALMGYTLAHNLLSSAQGAFKPHRQPFDTVFTLTECITSRKQMHGAATLYFWAAS